LSKLPSVRRALAAAGLIWAMTAAAPASAQFYFKATPFDSGRVEGDEPGLGLPLEGATRAEYRAALIWNMRAALNVAALQCQFAPDLGTLANYNAMLLHHRDELKSSFDTLSAYFVRVNKTAKNKKDPQSAIDAKVAQTALDTYGTKTYSGFSTVGAQLGFCQVAGRVSQEALFARKGHLIDVAQRRMREIRSSLIARRELQFNYYVMTWYYANLPNLDPRCWTRKDLYDFKRCPRAGMVQAAR